MSRKAQRAAGRPPRYAGTCAHLTAEERAARLAEGLSPTPGETVHAVIRPEQVQLCPPGGGDMDGTVTGAVFFGTDTHVHLTLADGQAFTVRRQNMADQPEPAAGTSFGLRLTPGALQILRG